MAETEAAAAEGGADGLATVNGGVETGTFKEEPESMETDQDGLKMEEEGSPSPEAESPVENGNHEMAEESDDEDDKPLSARLEEAKVKAEAVTPVKEAVKRKIEESDDDDEDNTSLAVRAKRLKMEAEVKKEEKEHHKEKKAKKKKKKDKDKKKHKHDKHSKDRKEVKKETTTPKKESSSPSKKKKEEEEVIWKWWEEANSDSSVKWTRQLEHNGVCFAPEYERLPKSVKFYYDGKELRLSRDAEEAATFYAKLVGHEYTTKAVFNNNYMKDWRKIMSDEERALITDIHLCNFNKIKDHFDQLSEERKNISKEQKKENKEKSAELVEKYGWAMVDGYRQRIANFRIEPPGVFRGRGEHPKQGKLKKRVMPEEVTINCSKGSKYPEPPPGHKWREVRHDNTVGWLATWTENIAGQNKYVMLNATSKIKGQKDWEKYEKARELHKYVDKIREKMHEDWKSKEMRIRQRGVALYFIDILALRAGNEKDSDETADTVGCCSLRVEHIKLHDTYMVDGKQEENVVEFDFPGKDSVPYKNSVPVEKRVFKNMHIFMENKEPGDDLFDRLNTSILNSHLSSLMDGLTAKVFRTYNASITLQQQLDKLTEEDSSEHEKVLSYNRANREVAILCNHQRQVSKNFDEAMTKLLEKVKEKRKEVKAAKKEVKELKHDKRGRNKAELEKKERKLANLRKQLEGLEVKATDKDENKTIALSTSKLNYLDPRITVQWCLKHNIQLTKVYTKTHRAKFQWAIDMVTSQYEEDGKEFDFTQPDS